MTIKPTLELRWYKKEYHDTKQVLQQKWINIDNGESEWKDIPVEIGESFHYL